MTAGARHYIPLLGFVLPTLVIGYGFVIPRSCIHGVNELSIGFGTTVLGAVVTYAAGIRSASRTSCPARPPWRRRLERYINGQAANPHGLFGYLLARLWKLEHRRVNKVTLDLLQLEPAHDVFELGCGPGWALRGASVSARDGRVLGVDVSATSLAAARITNRRGIDRGRVALRQVDGVELALEPASFDRAFSVHTIYFWPNPRRILAQFGQALREDGRLVLAFRGDSPHIPARFRDEVYRFYAAADVENMLLDAGFCDIQVTRDPDASKDLIWIAARKASPSPS